MPGTLFVVATPIGNLEDITLRALRVLREVDLVAAEDTRRTGNLLRHYEIRTRLLSLHEHNERSRIPLVLEHLRSGRSIALVSDAGTPGISDPGAQVVAGVRAAGLPIVPVPGPSALAAALSVGGVSDAPVTFLGFPPIRSKDRKAWLAQIATFVQHTVVCFESPHRLRRTLAEIAVILVDRPITLGREVTKVHEEWYTGSIPQVLALVGEPVGEFVVLIPPAPEADIAVPRPSDDQLANIFGQITHSEPRLSRRDAVRRVAEQTGLSPRAVYAAIERHRSG